jgi:hypothetical protein
MTLATSDQAKHAKANARGLANETIGLPQSHDS